jgi:membrane fusion protein (multidrug efflux system)
MEKKKTNKKFIIILVALVVLWCIRDIQIHAFPSHEETDDAQIEKI